jgi:hypothetical protein
MFLWFLPDRFSTEASTRRAETAAARQGRSSGFSFSGATCRVMRFAQQGVARTLSPREVLAIVNSCGSDSGGRFGQAEGLWPDVDGGGRDGRPSTTVVNAIAIGERAK